VSGLADARSPKYVENTWTNIRKLEKGRALFTVPATPIKCAGAPLKIFLSAEDYWTTKGRRSDISAEYHSALGKVFAIDKYAQRLSTICDERNLPRNFFRNLVEVDAVNKKAVFAKIVDGKQTEETTTEDFDMMHVTPTMRAIPELAASPLANEAGWIDVDKETLQHSRYPNVFSLGDCSSLPTSKTAAAVAGQNGILKANLRSAMAGMAPEAKYDGYTSCPLVLGRKELMLAEFSGYTGQPLETFPWDQGNPSKFAYWLKAEAMPSIYWDWLLKDSWHGVSQYRAMFSAFKDPSHNTNPTAA
jgi:sulfide:quinone oxidoreductase